MNETSLISLEDLPNEILANIFNFIPRKINRPILKSPNKQISRTKNSENPTSKKKKRKREEVCSPSLCIQIENSQTFNHTTNPHLVIEDLSFQIINAWANVMKVSKKFLEIGRLVFDPHSLGLFRISNLIQDWCPKNQQLVDGMVLFRNFNLEKLLETVIIEDCLEPFLYVKKKFLKRNPLVSSMQNLFIKERKSEWIRNIALKNCSRQILRHVWKRDPIRVSDLRVAIRFWNMFTVALIRQDGQNNSELLNEFSRQLKMTRSQLIDIIYELDTLLKDCNIESPLENLLQLVNFEHDYSGSVYIFNDHFMNHLLSVKRDNEEEFESDYTHLTQVVPVQVGMEYMQSDTLGINLYHGPLPIGNQEFEEADENETNAEVSDEIHELNWFECWWESFVKNPNLQQTTLKKILSFQEKIYILKHMLYVLDERNIVTEVGFEGDK